MKQKCCGLWESGLTNHTVRSKIFPRYSLKTDEFAQKLEGNMENYTLENSVTSNLENLVLLWSYLSSKWIQNRRGSRFLYIQKP